jgi:hypothetical protein
MEKQGICLKIVTRERKKELKLTFRKRISEMLRHKV